MALYNDRDGVFHVIVLSSDEGQRVRMDALERHIPCLPPCIIQKGEFLPIREWTAAANWSAAYVH